MNERHLTNLANRINRLDRIIEAIRFQPHHETLHLRLTEAKWRASITLSARRAQRLRGV